MVRLFSTEKVVYGAAPFPGGKLAWNHHAQALNLIHERRCLQLVKNLTAVVLEKDEVLLNGLVRAKFQDEAEAKAFATILPFFEEAGEGPAPSTPPRKRDRAVELLMATPAKTKREEGDAVPGTPPRCEASKMRDEPATPPAPKRARQTRLMDEEEPVSEKTKLVPNAPEQHSVLMDEVF
eukprot:CAMPEP_0181459854 /NCGR_PEP_ID=MMETSP1110-20121109/33040_1 /TAXON_ID=174948 /ORGANISM="Symbiodinium sp., Strain CCMP421" /LENGTH=179 /DNA_ID=CAMNT_0023584387 /DNA_START=52 /DNA_END=591 /DNA_ORIENTATION=+